MIGKIRLGYMAALHYGKKHFATAVKATKEMSSKVTTRYKKLPESYKTGI